MLSLAYDIFIYFPYTFDHRASPRLPRAAHRLPTSLQNRNPPSLRSRIRSLESRQRRQPSCTSRTTSTLSSTQKLLKPPLSVRPTAGFMFQWMTIFTRGPSDDVAIQRETLFSQLACPAPCHTTAITTPRPSRPPTDATTLVRGRLGPTGGAISQLRLRVPPILPWPGAVLLKG